MTDRRPRRIFVVLKRSLFPIHIFVTLGLLACRVDLKKIRPTERSQIIEFLKEHSLSAQNVFFPAPEERNSFITLPRLRLVDEKGRLYFERSGYSEDAADELLRAARERKVSGQIVFSASDYHRWRASFFRRFTRSRAVHPGRLGQLVCSLSTSYEANRRHARPATSGAIFYNKNMPRHFRKRQPSFTK
jgi:hypothetical protein